MGIVGPNGQTGQISAPNQQVTNYTWAQTVLQDAGLPTTPNNVLNITRWMVSEEPASNWYHNNNPLNINASGTGSDTFDSLTDSASRTAQYLAMSNYTGIRAALASNAAFPTFMSAVVSSPWAASHYGGQLFSGTPPVVSDQGSTLQAGSGASLDNINTPTQSPSTDPRQCGTNPGGVSIPFTGTKFFTRCQVKGIVGGLLVGLGGATIIVGVVILAGKSSSVRSAVGTVAGGIAGGPEGAAVGGSIAGAVGPQPKVATPAPVQAAATPVEDTSGDTDYDLGFSDALSAMMGGAFDDSQPRNTRQANKQAEALFDSLGISVPGPSSQRNSLGQELPF